MKTSKLQLEEIKKNYYSEEEVFDYSINEFYISQAQELHSTDKEVTEFIELLEERNRIVCLIEDTLNYINVEIDMDYIVDRIDNPDEYNEEDEELIDIVDDALYGNLYSSYFENKKQICTTLVEAVSILKSIECKLESNEQSYNLTSGILEIEECVDYLSEHFSEMLKAEQTI